MAAASAALELNFEINSINMQLMEGAMNMAYLDAEMSEQEKK